MKTGPFKPDTRAYPGVFIAGDDALYRYAPALRLLLDGAEHGPEGAVRAATQELLALLRSCEA